MRLLDTKQAADLVGCAKSTLDKQRVVGGGIPFLKIGRSVKYHPDDVEAYLSSRRVSSTSEAAQLASQKANTTSRAA